MTNPTPPNAKRSEDSEPDMIETMISQLIDWHVSCTPKENRKLTIDIMKHVISDRQQSLRRYARRLGEKIRGAIPKEEYVPHKVPDGYEDPKDLAIYKNGWNDCVGAATASMEQLIKEEESK